MIRVLALDLSGKTGWCFDGETPAASPIFGTWVLPVAGEDYGAAFVRLEDMLDDRITRRCPDIIAFEKPLDPRFNGATNLTTFFFLIGLAAIVEARAWRRGIRDIRAVPVGSWRSNFTGLRHQPKGDIKGPTMARCRQLGWAIQDDNQGDAAGLWSFVKAHTDPGFNYPIGDKPLFRGARQ